MPDLKEEKKADWLPVVAIGLGAVGVGAGLYFWAKKPKGVDPGSSFIARFKFDYLGQGGIYVIQLSLGNILIGNWFDHVEGLTWSNEITLPGLAAYTKDLICKLPEGLTPQKFDAEALIRTPTMSTFDYLIKVVIKDFIEVRKA